MFIGLTETTSLGIMQVEFYLLIFPSYQNLSSSRFWLLMTEGDGYPRERRFVYGIFVK